MTRLFVSGFSALDFGAGDAGDNLIDMDAVEHRAVGIHHIASVIQMELV